MKALLCLVLFVSCGADNEESNNGSKINYIEPTCDYCDAVPPTLGPLPNATPHVAMSPAELMFYPLCNEFDVPAQQVYVSNLTNDFLTITNISIVDDETYYFDGETGGETFLFSPVSVPVVMAQNERLAIDVWFSYSLKMHVGILKVETSFANNDDKLETYLYGKAVCD